jgi:TetR/AcrR family transcriptional regulator, cholesterol catabolism regulator
MNQYLPVISNLFKTYGIKSITMDDIARKLGISKKTLYHHFENKNDVVFQISQFEIESEFAELDKLSILYEHPIDQLMMISKFIVEKNCTFNSSLIHSMNKYYPQILEVIMSKRKEYILNLITNNLQAGINKGIYRKNVEVDIIHFVYSFLLDIKSVELYSNWINKDLEKMLNKIFQYHIRGFASQAGIEYLEKKFPV